MFLYSSVLNLYIYTVLNTPFLFKVVYDIFSGFEKEERSPQPGADLKYDLEISLEDAFHGLTTKIEIPMFVSCKSCKGTGAKDGKLEMCPKCNGSGRIRKVQQSPFGQTVFITTCADCGGSGKIIAEKCPECKGRGRKKQKKENRN
ncbi:MAG: zinc finger domain-containing protein [Euryarchaeota archaeon]|nr:zinc finger domain-containing protein [Euryarchaeota archaeon]